MNCIEDDRSIDGEESLTPSEKSSFLFTIQTLPSADYRPCDDANPKTQTATASFSYANLVYNSICYSEGNVREAPSVASAQSHDDEIPFNICQDAWGQDDDSKTYEQWACAIDVEDDVQDPLNAPRKSRFSKDVLGEDYVQNTSIAQQENRLSKGTLPDVSYHSRISSYVSGCSVLTEMRDCFERGRDEGSPTRHGFRGEMEKVEETALVARDEADAPVHANVSSSNIAVVAPVVRESKKSVG
jgi:hypothetical protein